MSAVAVKLQIKSSSVVTQGDQSEDTSTIPVIDDSPLEPIFKELEDYVKDKTGQDLVMVVNNYYKKYDSNSDGFLTGEEVARLLEEELGVEDRFCAGRLMEEAD